MNEYTINVKNGEPKRLLTKGKYCDRNIVVEAEAATVPKTATGENITLTDSAEAPLRGLTVYGKSTQDGTPTPDAPVPIVSVGEDGTTEVTIEGDADDAVQTLPISTPDGLHGIPVTSDGNYTDANGQQWVCDEIDFSRGVRVQRVGVKVFDGSESWGRNANNQFYWTYKAGQTPWGDCICTALIGSQKDAYDLKNDDRISLSSSAIWLYSKTLCMSSENIMAYFSAKYASGDPVKVYYILAEPIETPLTAEELAAYRSLHTNSPTTIIYADDNAGLSVDYDAEPYAAGVVDGKKAEYDAFWDGYQFDSIGVRKTYLPYAFAGQGWDDRTFRPKHDIMPKNSAVGIFRQTNIRNLKKILEDCGVILDTSQATSLQYAFGYAALTNLPKIDISSSTNNSGIFVDSPIEEIDELVVSEKSKFDSTSFRCTKLKHMIVTGTIANANFNVSACTLLDKESNTSIINALSATTTGLTATLSKAAIDAAFTADEWTRLVATKTNWTIVLAEEKIA